MDQEPNIDETDEKFEMLDSIDKARQRSESEVHEIQDSRTRKMIRRMKTLFTSPEFKKSCRPTFGLMISCLFSLVNRDFVLSPNDRYLH